MRVNHLVLFGLFFGLVSSDASADRLSDCMKITSDKERLTCFEKLAKRDVKPLITEKASKETKAVLAKIEPEKAQQAVEIETEEAKIVGQVELAEAKKINEFSNENLQKTQAEKGLDSITATISSLKKLMMGQWVVYLENGQKWQQKDSDRISLKVGDRVRLNKGSMGAVYLFKEGSSRNIRVKRLK
jgi:hypothetical protein